MNMSACGVRFFTVRPTEHVEAWLSAHCRSEWDVKLSGMREMPDGGVVKQLTVYFSEPKDRQVFRDHFMRH